MDIKLFGLGCYICKTDEPPHYLKGISDKFISLSRCLCTHEPQIAFCSGWKPNGDNAEYIKEHGFTVKTYSDYSREVQNAFDSKRLFFDGRFTHEKDARYFYDKYFKSDSYMLISFAAEGKYFDMLTDSGFEQSRQPFSLPDRQLLGFDIIGWDIDGFHSFLCNSFNEVFKEITFSNYGVMNTDYSIVKETAERMQGMGDAAEWLPAAVYSVY